MNAMLNAAPLSPRTTAFRMTRPLSPSHFKTVPPVAPPSSLPQRLLSVIAAAIFGSWRRKPTSLPPTDPSIHEAGNHEAGAWARVCIHTDGSFYHVDGRMGWGAVICGKERGDLDVLGALAGGSWGGNSLHAEANAIASALESLPLHTSHVLLLTDCKGMINTLRRAVDPHSRGVFDGDGGLDVSILQRIRSAAQGKSVRLKWVKGHDGNLLNEAADILASFGSGRSLPIYPRNHSDHPRARATRIARLIEAPAP